MIKTMFGKKVKTVSFGFLLTVILFFFSCSKDVPVITSIDPKIGNLGEVITLKGSNFGASREDSYVTIASRAPTGSSYFSWQDDQIIVRVPELGESGLVYVHVNGKKSNGLLFSNAAVVPRPIDGEELGLQPRITSVSPHSGAPGSLIIINGSNFGVSRENSLLASSGVFFSFDYDAKILNPYAVREPEFIEVSEIEFGYEFWSTREIHIRLPDGAASGNIEVRTPHGRSRPLFFDVSSKPGTKTFKDSRNYIINYTVDIRVLEATRPNTLYLWIPSPSLSPSQRNVTLISRNVEPFIENHRGTSLFKLDNLNQGLNQSITLSYRVEVFTVETSMRTQPIRQERNALTSAHTQSSYLIPSENQRIMTTVNTIIGREQNPYNKAKLIYDWILRNIKIYDTQTMIEMNIESELQNQDDETRNTLSPAESVITAFETRQSDPFNAALLFTTMTRAAGVPCIPIAGVMVDQNGMTFRHYWSEFWIDGFGWVPVDPAMGAGAVVVENVLLHAVQSSDPSVYYFGNIDNMRIAFSRGELALTQMENRSRLVSHTQSYSLQSIWEEATGGLESYSSFWGDIVITGVYQ